MTAPECRACPFPDSVAALELVRLREGIGALCDEWAASLRDRTLRPGWSGGAILADLRALLDDNQGER
jgi:hypothetical protein